MSKLILESYSDKSFVIRVTPVPDTIDLSTQRAAQKAESLKYKDAIIKLGGKWNPNLTGGPGYIFSNRHLTVLQEFVTGVNLGKSLDRMTGKIDKYQVVSYTIYVPEIKEEGFLVVGSNKNPIKVIGVLYENSKVKYLELTEDSLVPRKAMIIDGKWQLRDLLEEHSIEFN